MAFPDYLIPDAVFVANTFRKKNGQPYGKRAQYKIRSRLKESGAIVMIAGCAFVDTRVFDRAPPAPPEQRPRFVRRGAAA